MNVKSHPTRVQLVSGFVLAVALSPAPLVLAGENSWISGNGNWEDASNWSLSALPVSGDNVRFDGSDYAVNKLSSSPLLGGVSIVGDKISLNLYLSGLHATNVLIGDYEHSYLNQIDNSATSISETLTLGQYQQAFGQYIIGQFVQDQNGTWQGLDGGTLHTANAIVGDEGYGHFHQLLGTTTIDGTLTIAHKTTSGGWFELGYGDIKDGVMESVYGGTLDVTNIIVGDAGDGKFNQQSGTTTIKETLTVGKESGSSGWVRLGYAAEDNTGIFQSIAGGTLSATNVIIGDAGDGDVNQTNSNAIIAETLTLGDKKGSDGLYMLGLTMANAQGTQIVGGGTLSAKNAIIGNYGTGNFHQFNGDTTIKETLTIAQQSGSAGSLALGYGYVEDGTMRSADGGTLSATNVVVGDAGNGKFHQQSGTTNITESLTVGKESGSSGWVGLGMTLEGQDESIDGGQLTTTDMIVGVAGDGIFHQMNGSAIINHDLLLGVGSTSTGTYIFNKGNLQVDGTLMVGDEGIGIFSQTGGEADVKRLTIGEHGSFTLDDGIFTAQALNIIDGGTFQLRGGTFNVSGGSEATLSLAEDVEVSGDLANLFLNEGGTLKGKGIIEGDVDNEHGTVAPGSSPGKLTIAGDYTQETGGTLQIEVAGITAGTAYDVLQVTGVATLAGMLDVALLNGYSPDESLWFNILYASSISANGLTITDGWEWRITDGTMLSISREDGSVPVPEPTTWMLMLFGLTLLASNLRRKQR